MLGILESYQNSNQKFCFYDYETEGLNLVKHKPWQVGYIITQGGKITKKVDRKIWIPDLNITEGAKIVTRFNYEEYKKVAEPAKEVLIDFEKDAEDAIMVGHNTLGYDVFVSCIWYKMVGRNHNNWFMDKAIDTNALSKAYLTNKKNNDFESWDDFLCWQASSIRVREKGIKSSQTAMLKHFGIEFDENMLHDAIYDVIKNKQIFEQLIHKLEL